MSDSLKMLRQFESFIDQKNLYLYYFYSVTLNEIYDVQINWNLMSFYCYQLISFLLLLLLRQMFCVYRNTNVHNFLMFIKWMVIVYITTHTSRRYKFIFQYRKKEIRATNITYILIIMFIPPAFSTLSLHLWNHKYEFITNLFLQNVTHHLYRNNQCQQHQRLMPCIQEYRI